MAKEMGKTWEPSLVEDTLYQEWEQNGYFKPDDARRGRRVFSIVMPPPNITGQLHLGHALDNTLPDVLVRYHRMLGDDTLWIPGTDHASIATEVKVVEQLAKEGITKESLGRDAFLEQVWQWRDKYGTIITRQLRKMGCSCDWSRERFTMDEGCSKAVREVFVRLYEQGLIYRGNRIINWCPECKTALSDAEVEYEEQAGHMWHIHYPAQDGSQGVIVATTRPETMLGDTGVAVHPDDERYTHLVGKKLRLPLRDRLIPVVADAYVDREFGTGAVKMTPAHDPNDFEVAMRHNLEIDRVMNDDGTMNEKCGVYAGLPALEARKRIVEDLRAQGLLVEIKDHVHNVGQCYRCSHTVEPLVSLQWFVDMKPLAEPALKATADRDIRFIPERFEKTYLNFMDNIRDWCISRQLWWGHRIPVWYCDGCGEVIVSREDPKLCPKCGSAHLRQDEDVLDTWFSSALWPFSTMGWPEETDDLARFYPTSVLACGYEIIFFWVARMIVSGLRQMGELPFPDVLVHGIVRDEQGRKMSKSLGNGLDPLEAIAEFGADAMRFSLLMGVAPGNDIRFKGTEKLEAARNFANKMWNASRFAIMNLDGECDANAPKSLADRWIISRTHTMIREISAHLESYDAGLAAQKLHDFIWSELCDWYLELAKAALYGGTPEEAAATRHTLKTVLTAVLKLLHPFMPFLTDEIYRYLPDTQGSIMLTAWPELADFPQDESAVSAMESIMEVIRSIRNLRAEMNVPPSKKSQVLLRPSAKGSALMQGAPYIERLASASQVALVSGSEAPANTVCAVSAAAEAFLPLNELIDLAKERARLEKELANAQSEIERLSGKLNNPGFTGKAPAAVIEGERAKLATAQNLLQTITARLASLE